MAECFLLKWPFGDDEFTPTGLCQCQWFSSRPKQGHSSRSGHAAKCEPVGKPHLRMSLDGCWVLPICSWHHRIAKPNIVQSDQNFQACVSLDTYIVYWSRSHLGVFNVSSDRRCFFWSAQDGPCAGSPEHVRTCASDGFVSMKDLPTCVKCSNFARNDKTCIYIGGWSSWSSIQ